MAFCYVVFLVLAKQSMLSHIVLIEIISFALTEIAYQYVTKKKKKTRHPEKVIIEGIRR